MASCSSSSPEISAAPTTITADNSSNYSSLEDVLEDLSSRFILNLPESELASVERICFQVEQAHWFYEDFVREGNPQFPSLPLKRFSQIFFHACPVLHQWSSDFEIAFNNFMQYKTRVPVCGAIMLNDTWEKCILVKGWKSSAGWGFPKGKINEDEEPYKCAIREVYEETGYDLEGQLDPENVIELSIKQQKISLYIVPGVPEDYPFKTRTRKEISKIDWFKLSDLPTWKKSGIMSGKFYLISPFIAPLKNFIQDRKPSSLKRRTRRARNGIPFTNGATQVADESAESSLESPPHLHSIPDSATQESSSQSSYDNGGLQTPSPEYSQPRLNEPYVSNPSNRIDSRTETIYRALAGDDSDVHPDAHLTRLMESLTMSVGKKGGDDITPVLTQLSTNSPVPVASTPVPTTASSGDSPRAEPSDWSSHAPRRMSDRQGLAKSSTMASTPAGKPAYKPVHIDTALSSNGAPPSPLYSPAVARPPSAAPASLPSSSPRHQRSLSAMSFTSPRSVELAPAKRMKQLALLESVVDESARMTPTLEQMSRMQQPPTLPSIHGHGPMLRPATSGPVQGMIPSFPQQSLLYSSGMGHLPPARLPSVPVPTQLPPLSSVVGDDPFTVRPRNGEIPVPHMHARIRQSMNETQLAPMLQRPYGNLQGPPPHQVPYLPPAPMYGGHYPPHPQGRISSMPMVGPSHMPVQRTYTPGPIAAPSFEGPHLPHHPRNSPLLSILNANGPNRNQMSSMITPVGVVNGIEHR